MNMQTAHGPPMPGGAPSRRGVILGGLLIPAASVTIPAPAQAYGQAWREALPSLSFLHRNGRRAALAAMAAGLDPADLFCILLTGPNAPKLLFDNGQRGATVSGDGSVK